MSEVIITVRGEYEARLLPEEGRASLVVQIDAPDRGAAVEGIAAAARPIRDDLTARKDAGGLVEWSSQRVAVWSDRPWNSDGKQLPLVHRASVEITATFSDFAALSWWLSEVAENDSVRVNGVSWQLTAATAKATEAEVAASAVRVAVDRATAYAAAIGLATVTALEIADLGLLSRPDEPRGPHMVRAMAFADAGAAPSMDLQPQEVVVTAGVEARFLAR